MRTPALLVNAVRRAVSTSLLAGAVITAVIAPLTSPLSAWAATTSVPAAPSAGCTLAQAAAPGTTNLLLAAGGDQGAYEREIPHSYSGKHPVPVIIDLHGYGESATIQAALSALGTYGESKGFITITPQVAGPVPLWNTSLGSKDLAFIGGLLQRIDATLCVDRNRTFVTGYSNGAMMASSVACQFAGQVAAVSPVAGIETPAGCRPSRRVPVVTFHGTADQYVAYTGGLGPAALKLPAPDGSNKTLGQTLGRGPASGVTGPSVPQLAAKWAVRNGCSPTPSVRKVTSDVTLISFRCPANGTVELYRVTGGGHAWPGSLLSKSITSAVGKVTYTISANTIMWAFFMAHPL
jgi:polyhydroxybutyrate depolymerase